MTPQTRCFSVRPQITVCVIVYKDTWRFTTVLYELCYAPQREFRRFVLAFRVSSGRCGVRLIRNDAMWCTENNGIVASSLELR